MTEKLKFTSMVTGEFIEFEAYITDMGQSFASTWNTEDVFGRNDPIATFQGTKRTISLSLEVPAKDRGQARTNLRNCAKLATFLYPGYSGDSDTQEANFEKGNKKAGIAPTLTITAEQHSAAHLVRTPLVKIKFGNLINSMSAGDNDGLLGFIDNYSFTPNMEAGMFGTKNSLYPRTISLSLSFTVLHQSDLGHVSKVQKVTDEDLEQYKKDLESGKISQEEFNKIKKLKNQNKDLVTHKWLGKKLPFM